MNRPKILVLAPTPFLNDGLTKIEMDVYKKYKDTADFEFATSFSVENKFGDYLKEEHIPVHQLSRKKSVFPYMYSIYSLVKMEKYDVVYINGNSAMMIMEALPARFGGAKRIVAHCHNTKSDFPLVHYISKPIFNLLVNKKIGCSSLAAKWAFCGKNIEVIPNGIDTRRFAFNETSRCQVRKELGITEETLIGHIGRFTKQKNHQRILEIYKDYRTTEPTAKLLLIGDGENREEIINLVRDSDLQDKVFFIRETDKPQNYMSAMDVMLMPSLYEGLCLVALEAQANGLPLVISENIAEETVVSENVKKVKLSAPNIEWIKALSHWKTKGHNSNDNVEELKQLDWASMMDNIGDALFE